MIAASRNCGGVSPIPLLTCCTTIHQGSPTPSSQYTAIIMESLVRITSVIPPICSPKAFKHPSSLRVHQSHDLHSYTYSIITQETQTRTETSSHQSAPDLPTFTLTTGTRGNDGLDMLAAAAAFSSSEKQVEEGCVPGPLNPAASLAPKVAKRDP